MTRRPREGRALTPGEQLKVLSRVWRNDRDGYVFLPWIRGDSATKEARRKNYREGRAFEWPRERSAILEHLQAHQADDLYFCPNLFNGKRRNEELVYGETCLYADLDAVDPRRVRTDRRPTIAWESSPGRFQGVWLLAGMSEGASWPGRENQRLTYELGADLSGWDSTQLLRVPGKPNFKPEYRGENGEKGAPGRLLWDNGPRYVWDDFDDLPEVGVVGGGDEFDLMDEELLEGIDRHEVWARVRMRCSAAVRALMRAHTDDDVAGADRSDALWQIERDLADAGCTLAEIVAVVRATPWNKFRDRQDELKQLKTEAAKAIAAREEGALEIEGSPKPARRTTAADLFLEDVPRPRWLVRDVWPEGACGFIAGDPKSYKSWLAMDLAVSLATGSPFLGQFPVVGGPRRVLYLQQEDSKTLVKDRLGTVLDGKSARHHPHGHLSVARAGKGGEGGGVTIEWAPGLALPLFSEVRTGFTASDESWQGWLDEYVAEERIAMVLVDTLFTSAGNLDLDKSQEVMTRMLRPLSAIADKHSCAVAVVHHNKKNGGGGEGHRAGADMLGSRAMHAWVECALYVRSRTELERLPGVAVEVSSGKTEYLGVPGVEIAVEREAKAAEEIRFRVGIPRMARHTGDRWVGAEGEALAAADRWMPQVEMGWRHREEDRGGRDDEGGDRKKGRRKTERPAGGLIVARLREMGVTDSRGKTLDEIAEVLDRLPRGISKQLKSALEKGEVEKRGDKWHVVG